MIETIARYNYFNIGYIALYLAMLYKKYTVYHEIIETYGYMLNNKIIRYYVVFKKVFSRIMIQNHTACTCLLTSPIHIAMLINNLHYYK